MSVQSVPDRYALLCVGKPFHWESSLHWGSFAWDSLEGKAIRNLVRVVSTSGAKDVALRTLLDNTLSLPDVLGGLSPPLEKETVTCLDYAKLDLADNFRVLPSMKRRQVTSD